MAQQFTVPCYIRKLNVTPEDYPKVGYNGELTVSEWFISANFISHRTYKYDPAAEFTGGNTAHFTEYELKDGAWVYRYGTGRGEVGKRDRLNNKVIAGEIPVDAGINPHEIIHVKLDGIDV